MHLKLAIKFQKTEHHSFDHNFSNTLSLVKKITSLGGAYGLGYRDGITGLWAGLMGRISSGWIMDNNKSGLISGWT